MPVFRVERNKGYTVMSNYHLRDKSLSLKSKGLLPQILSLPEDWDYTLSGLCCINRESKDAIRSAVNKWERARYIERTRPRTKAANSAATSTSSTNSLFLCRRRWINRRRKTQQRENQRRKIQRN